MPTYNSAAVSDTAIAFQKPITLQQGRALRDNPLAIAEADSSAPRIVAAAINNWHARVELDGTTTPVAVTGLDTQTIIQVVGSFANGASDSAELQMSGSSDGGTTWGSWFVITASPGQQNTRYGVHVVINLATGVYTNVFSEHGDLGTGPFDAVRFRHSTGLIGSGNAPARLAVFGVGRAP